MASSSSASTTNPLFGVQITEKLSKTNHALWKEQVLSTIRGARLEGFINGKTVAPAAEIQEKAADGKLVNLPNPAHDEWFAQDQQVLGFLFTSVNKEVFAQIAGATTAFQAWTMVTKMFTAQTRARSMNVRLALATTRKGTMNIAEYFSKMKSLSDELAASGKPMDDEDFTANVLNGLDHEYNPLITALVTRVEPVTVSDLYSQLLSFETRLELQDGSGSSVNTANRGRGGSSGGRTAGRGAPQGRGNCGRGGFGRGFGRGRGYQAHNNNNQRAQGNSNDNRPLCQVCYKRGHLAPDCWHRYEEDFSPDERNVASAMTAYNLDANWYADSGASDHVTGELEKLSIREKYKGGDHIHTASGAGMEIKHIGHTTVSTPNSKLHLRNVLHVPQAAKNLVSVSRLTKDNNVFFELHPDFFLIKDRDTKSTILKGRCRNGLYPLPASQSSRQIK